MSSTSPQSSSARRFARRRGPAAPLVVIAALVAPASCGQGAGPSAPIDREVFISTYVDLRAAALESDSAVLTDEARADVLDRHGVTAEDLLGFAEVHGRDVEFMREVWNEVEVRMDARRPGGADEG